MSTELSRFAKLRLKPALLDAIADTGYTTPTAIQTKAIPLILSGTDILAEAQTGTGKTAAYVLPALQRLSELNSGRAKPGQPRCLVLTPTRELAVQVADSVKVYASYLPLKCLAVFGGVKINPQRMAMRKPVDILIATPGRLFDLAEQNIVRLIDIDTLILDEADRMLDMGFRKDITKVISLLPRSRQTLLFSATFSDDIRKLGHSLLNKPKEISVVPEDTSEDLVEHIVHLVDKSRKRALLSKLFNDNIGSQMLVFTRTKNGANRLVDKLRKEGIEALAIHGDKSQGARTRALNKFKERTLRVLVATDLAARGIDIEHLAQVVNYELPHVPADYVHRIGRTGRAGVSGRAISLVNIDELDLLQNIEKHIGRAIQRVDVEGFTGHSEAPGSSTVDLATLAHQQKLR